MSKEQTKPAPTTEPTPATELSKAEVVPEKPKAAEAAPAPEVVKEPVPEQEEKKAEGGEEKKEEAQKELQAMETITQATSFKEETNVVGDLPEAQKKALDELKQLVQEALNKHEFSKPPAPKEEEKKEAEVQEEKKEEETKEEKKEEGTKEDKKEEIKEGKKIEVEKKEEKTETDKKEEEKKDMKEEEKKEEKKDEVKKEEKKDEVKKEEKKEEPEKMEVEEEKKEEKKGVEETKEEEKKEVKEEKKEEPEKKEDKPSSSVAETAKNMVEAIKEMIVPTSSAKPQESTAAEPKEAEPQAPQPPLEPEEVSIWGVPLLQDERSDVILLKFLRARDFNVRDALKMLKECVAWRKDEKIDERLEEGLGNEFEKMVFLHGVAKQGQQVIYNSYSELKDLLADKGKRDAFLSWRIQFQEKCVRALDFSPTAKSSFVYISNFKNAPGLGRRSPWKFIRKAVETFEKNYPECVAKELFINVPWWYVPYYKIVTSFMPPRTRSKMVIVGPLRSADAIFKYVAPEQVPVDYYGLSKDGEQEFSTADKATEIVIKPNNNHVITMEASEGCTLVWELRVLGWDVSYEAQFQPTNEGSYTVIVAKNRKVLPTDEALISDTFKVNEAGKVLLTLDNQTSKKKKLLYRYKTKSA